jgi:hypothetical protein
MHQALQDQITGVGRYAAQESRCGIKVGTVCKLWQHSIGPNATPGPSINSGHSLHIEPEASQLDSLQGGDGCLTSWILAWLVCCACLPFPLPRRTFWGDGARLPRGTVGRVGTGGGTWLEDSFHGSSELATWEMRISVGNRCSLLGTPVCCGLGVGPPDSRALILISIFHDDSALLTLKFLG